MPCSPRRRPVPLSCVRRFLVLGEPLWRERLTRQLELITGAEVVDCDPALGDCVMYVRLEGIRFDAFFFAGFNDPVTRGALPIVAERSALVPLLERVPHAAHDGYLFRLAKALGFRDENERSAVLEAVPKAAVVPSVLIGRDTLEPEALLTLAGTATSAPWQWDAFIEGVRAEVER